MTKQMPKSIVEIAKLAGVSKSTVSRVLNNTGYVSEQSRKKVMAVVQATGFIVNEAAKTLKTQRQDTIAVIIPRLESQAVAQMVKGINLALTDSSTNLVLGITNLAVEKELYYLQYFSQQGVQGIIFMARQITAEHESIIRQSPVPIIILAQKSACTQSIAFDEFDGAHQVATALFTNRQRLGYIGVSTDDYAIGIERLAGVQAAAKTLDKQLVFELGDFTANGGYQATKRLLAREPQLEGIIAATDTIAVGVMEYLREYKIEIGQEIAVAGFGDSPFSVIIQPQLASVHYPYVEAGALAVKRIFQPQQPEQTILPTHFITRSSCE